MGFPNWMQRIAKRVSLGVGIFTLAATPASPGQPRVPIKSVPELVPEVEVKKLGGKYVLRRAKAALQVVFAQHRSHSSHASHRSHSSHYSGVSAPEPRPAPAPVPPTVAAPPPSPSSSARHQTSAKTFVDTFDDETLAPESWRIGILLHPQMDCDSRIGVRAADGRLEITPRALTVGAHFNGVVSSETFDMWDATLVVRAAQIPSTGAIASVAVAQNASNWYGFVAVETELRFASAIAGRHEQTNIRYDATQQRYWRLRIKDGGVWWETSADGNRWKEQRHITLGFPPTGMAVVIETGTERSVRSSIAAFDDVILKTR